MFTPSPSRREGGCIHQASLPYNLPPPQFDLQTHHPRTSYDSGAGPWISRCGSPTLGTESRSSELSWRRTRLAAGMTLLLRAPTTTWSRWWSSFTMVPHLQGQNKWRHCSLGGLLSTCLSASPRVFATSVTIGLGFSIHVRHTQTRTRAETHTTHTWTRRRMTDTHLNKKTVLLRI